MEKDEAIEKGLLRIIGKEIDDEYISKLKTLSVNPELAAEIGKLSNSVHAVAWHRKQTCKKNT